LACRCFELSAPKEQPALQPNLVKVVQELSFLGGAKALLFGDPAGALPTKSRAANTIVSTNTALEVVLESVLQRLKATIPRDYLDWAGNGVGGGKATLQPVPELDDVVGGHKAVDVPAPARSVAAGRVLIEAEIHSTHQPGYAGGSEGIFQPFGGPLVLSF
jgi:hypothetical protein